MEKQRIKRNCKSGKRLLICALSSLFLWGFFPANLQAQSINTPQKMEPVPNQKLYPKLDIKYEIYIQKAKPANVQLQTQTLSNGIELKTLRKTEYYTDEGGTLLELWYRFDKKGTYTIPRLTVLVNGRRRYFNFEPITIENDPANQLPRIVIQFENGTTIYSDSVPSTKPIFNAEVGETLKFRVNLQYTTQLVQFNWEIPQDSIFKQTKTYEITEIKYREKNYSNELIPVADFEWTALAKGLTAIPRIRLTATAYKGYRSELITPQFFINFIQTTDKDSDVTENSTLFEAAFDSSYLNFAELPVAYIDMEVCEKIAQLRMAERTNILDYFKIKKERVELENFYGLPSENGEFNLVFLHIFAVIVVIFTVLLLFFLKKNKIIPLILSAVLLTCCIALCSYYSVLVSKKHAIAKGCQLYSIPEENAKSTSEISIGNRVTITETTGNWYYIELGTISGWCKKDQVILIK